jgi:hypothetical protein
MERGIEGVRSLWAAGIHAPENKKGGSTDLKVVIPIWLILRR